MVELRDGGLLESQYGGLLESQFRQREQKRQSGFCSLVLVHTIHMQCIAATTGI